MRAGQRPLLARMETMQKTVIAMLTGTAVIVGTTIAANAADILYDPPPIYDYKPPKQPKKALGGWYLRGHIGMTNQGLRRLEHPAFAIVTDHEFLDKGGFASAPLFGGGVGYQMNEWLRGDITVEYRGKSSFSALDRWWADAETPVTNHYTAKKSELLFMANAYADLGNYHGLMPYVGAGIGTSRNTISHFNDTNVQLRGGGYAPAHSMWQLAWALHAGVGYQLTDRATLDFGYSYTHLGNARTGELRNYDPSIDSLEPMTFRGLHSHDFKLGLRYALY
jgi:opacity protein-like surface antigen